MVTGVALRSVQSPGSWDLGSRQYTSPERRHLGVKTRLRMDKPPPPAPTGPPVKPASLPVPVPFRTREEELALEQHAPVASSSVGCRWGHSGFEVAVTGKRDAGKDSGHRQSIVPTLVP